MKVVIAEKPSVAKELAKVLGARNVKDGYIEGNDYCFTWAFGHLITLAKPEFYGYTNWAKENLPIIPKEFKLTVRQTADKGKLIDDPGVIKQLKTINNLFNKASEIIVATDAAREGELIFRYIYNYLNCNKPFRRLWISSLTDEAIQNGFKNLKPGQDYDNLYYSAKIRSEADWLIGFNATQALSIASGTNSLFSLGRVQTPTLSMISQRAIENKSFKPEKYYQVQITVSKDGRNFNALILEHFFIKDQALDLLNKINDSALIENIEINALKETPPLLHDLSSLQQEANKKYGFTADETLNLAQGLYEAKLISYPRTGSRYISEDVFSEINSLIKILGNHDLFYKTAKNLDSVSLNRKSVNSNKVTDHHALLITKIKPYNLKEDSQKIYDLIAGRLLESFNGDCIKEKTKITILSGITLIASGTVIKVPGWRAVFNTTEEDDNKLDEQNLPIVSKGEVLPIIFKGLLEKFTKPQPLFTEASLLKSMETAGKLIEDEVLREAMKENGLGTPATRASIIETLIKRNYIVRDKKNLLPTDKGLAVYNIVKDKLISQAELTGQWENNLQKISNGLSYTEFKSNVENYAKDITIELLNSGQGLSTFNESDNDSAKIKCPFCKKGFIKFYPKSAGCSEYKNGCSYSVYRIVAEKTLTDNQLTSLILKGKTNLIKGFKSKKTGRNFDASLTLIEGKINFEFFK